MSKISGTEPPKTALRFLSLICPRSLYEGIEGDLVEQFEADLATAGVAIARRKFRRNVIRFFQPGILFRNNFAFRLINTAMFGSYFTIMIRAMRKSLAYSLINVIGLAIGIASCLLIFNYVRFEQSFDAMHPDADRLFRVNQTAIWTPNGGVMTSSGPQLALALKDDYPEIDQSLRIHTPGDMLVRFSTGDGDVKSFRESRVLAADSNFFSFFNFKLKEGDPRTALVGQNKVVISDEVAKKFFGDQPALGKTLLFGDDGVAVAVSGVTEPQPANIHFHFDYLQSIHTNPGMKRFEWSFIWSQVVTYVKLKPNVDVPALQSKIQSIAERRIKPSFKRLEIDFDDFVKDKGGWHLYLQPVTDIRLGSGKIFQRFEEVGDKAYVYIFSGVAGFILLIAAINFINLSTARATTRAKEVGVKKTMGAIKNSLIAQFQFESIFISTVATVLGIGFTVVLRPVIFQFTGFDLPAISGTWEQVVMLLGLPIILGFIAGIYPAFYLTSFQPIQVLKGKLATGMKSGGLRNGLVTLQFTIAIALMSATLLVFQQIHYMQTKRLGLDKENILIIDNAQVLGAQLQSFRNEIAAKEGVIDASISTNAPGRGYFEDIFKAEGQTETFPVGQAKIDEHYLSSYGISLATGRSFRAGSAADSTSIILNENAARIFGWTPEEALGKYIIYFFPQKLEVIGVVKDFHFRSLHAPITPMMFLAMNSNMWGDQRVISIKFKTDDVSRLMSSIEHKWKELAPTAPVEIQFYDEVLASQYQSEQRLGRLFAVFACFSIGVGIIGLIGLVAYSAEQRKKEIGIRKVFGASIARIFVMINTQYLQFILIALVLATPFAWWGMSQWLDSFAYHIEITPIAFVVAGVAEIVLAVICVGYLSLRAATLNPSAVLRDE